MIALLKTGFDSTVGMAAGKAGKYQALSLFLLLFLKGAQGKTTI